MFVDSEDYEHLISQLTKDFPLLKTKLDDIRIKINEQIKKRKYFAPLLKFVEWRNHATNVKWTIHYNVGKENGMTTIRCFPITAYNNKEGQKDYFVFCLDKLNPNLAESHLFKVFRGHFISRYLERTNSTNETPHLVIINFMMLQDIGINYHYNQNEKWLMYLNSRGIGMIREDRLCLVFDTFLTLPELKPDQNQAILQYIDELSKNKPVDFCLIFFHLQMGNGIEWKTYFTDDKVINVIKNLDIIKPRFAQAIKYKLSKFF